MQVPELPWFRPTRSSSANRVTPGPLPSSLTFHQLEGLCCAHRRRWAEMALTIGQVAKSTGVAARTIRFYEAVGVLAAPRRTGAGYRQYSDDEVQQLLFIRRARARPPPPRSQAPAGRARRRRARASTPACTRAGARTPVRGAGADP